MAQTQPGLGGLSLGSRLSPGYNTRKGDLTDGEELARFQHGRTNVTVGCFATFPIVSRTLINIS